MRKIIYYAVFLISIGCQDVIEVDLPTEEPRLVIDALIKIDDINRQTALVQVKASLSSSFFDSVSPAQLEGITIKNTTTNTTLTLVESIPGTGLYESEWEMEQLTQGALELNIKHADQIYLAKTTFVPTVPIDKLEQGNTTLFGEEETEVIVSFTDEGTRDDFYLFDFDFGEYLVTEDEFYQGQQFEFSFFYDSKLEDERLVTISIYGVDKDFYNYMNQLIFQSGPDTGPFSSPATTVKGNIINVTNNSDSLNVDNVNFALGYFAVCQTFSDSLLIKK